MIKGIENASSSECLKHKVHVGMGRGGSSQGRMGRYEMERPADPNSGQICAENCVALA